MAMFGGQYFVRGTTGFYELMAWCLQDSVTTATGVMLPFDPRTRELETLLWEHLETSRNLVVTQEEASRSADERRRVLKGHTIGARRYRTWADVLVVVEGDRFSVTVPLWGRKDSEQRRPTVEFPFADVTPSLLGRVFREQVSRAQEFNIAHGWMQPPLTYPGLAPDAID